jgi:hypothetical protein
MVHAMNSPLAFQFSGEERCILFGFYTRSDRSHRVRQARHSPFYGLRHAAKNAFTPSLLILAGMILRISARRLERNS